MINDVRLYTKLYTEIYKDAAEATTTYIYIYVTQNGSISLFIKMDELNNTKFNE